MPRSSASTYTIPNQSRKSCSKEEGGRMSLLLPRHGASVSSLLELPPALPSLAHRPGPLLIKASCLSSSEQQNERQTYSVQVHGGSKDFTQQVEKDTEIVAIFRDRMGQRACFIRQSRAIWVLSCCKRRHHAFHEDVGSSAGAFAGHTMGCEQRAVA